MEEKIYTIKELSAVLQLNIETLKKYCREGKIQAFKVGPRWRVTQSALDKFMRGE